MRVRLVLGLALVLSLAFRSSVAALFQESKPDELLKAADEMIQAATRLRGLELKSPIAKGVKSRAEISEFLNARIAEEYDENLIQKEARLLRTIGMIPPSLDYRSFVIRLLTEQVEGYYDPKNKTFYIASWLPAADQKPTMIHEITHALQDQHFDVGRIMEQDLKQNNDDRALAHRAIVEGDGLAVMMNYLLEPAKRGFHQLEDLAKLTRGLMVSAQSQYEVFRSAPPYLQETLLFPYGHGASFLQKIWAQSPSWQAVNQIYARLPSSTEQIIHPEKYVGRDEPKAVDAESIVARLGDKWRVTYRNVLGEFTMGLLLDVELSEERARRSAAGWGGDQVLLLENKEGAGAALICTDWDNAVEADEFLSALQDWFQKRRPLGVKVQESAAGYSLVQNGEVYAVRREGTAVRFIIGFPEAELAKLANF